MSGIKAAAAATEDGTKVIKVIIRQAECLAAAPSLLSPYFNDVGHSNLISHFLFLRQSRPQLMSAAWEIFH